ALPPAFQQFSTELLAQLQKGDFNVNVRHLTVFLMLVVAMVPFVVWMVRLMYKSFSVVCNVRGGKAIGTFVIGLLIAEALSKACIIPLALTAITKPSQLSEKSVAATSDNFTKAGSDFVTLLQEQKFAQATTQFDPAMIKALPEPKLRNVWQDLTKEGGAFQKQLGASVQSYWGSKLVLVTCQFERKAFGIRVVYNSQKRISGLWIVEPDPALVSK
ncbi:MAG: DUF3887 domain-containing protein, partial [Limisphaerales bacterium]